MSKSSNLEPKFLELRGKWRLGGRDREDSLQLLFLCWWHWAEPEFITGLPEDRDTRPLWHEIYSFFGGSESNDSEFLYVAWIMVLIWPWELGDQGRWELVADELEREWRKIRPEGFSPDEFQGRGEYGDYFAEQVRVTEF